VNKELAELLRLRFGYTTDIDADIPAEALLMSVLSRRSQRRYTAQPVPESLLAMLLACAQSASSKSDLQQYSIIRIKDAEKRTAIAQLIPDMPWIALAPVFLVFCGDIRRGQQISRLRGYANVNNTLDSFMNSAVDAALAMQTLILAAEACGLGCCPISAVRVRIGEVAAHLELPDGVFPICGLCVGYPASVGHLTMRLPPRLIVHTDRYDDSALEAELAAYDARRESHFATTPERQLYRERFGVSGQYGWSEHAARRLTAREREHFKPYLEEHGFDLD
jgi:nitroreductase/FMN reductase [NAD(P)H]